MGVTDTWVSPAAGGVLDLATGGTVNETIWDAVISDLLHLGGTAGYVPAAVAGVGNWVDFTPGAQQGGALTVNDYAGRYRIVGKLATVVVTVQMVGGGATAGAPIYITGIPAAVAPAQIGDAPPFCVGFFHGGDVSGLQYEGSVFSMELTKLLFRVSGTNNGTWLGASPAWTLGGDDYISLTAMWRIA